MDELKAKLLALEAVVIALARSSPEKSEVFAEFTNISNNMIKTLSSKATKEHPDLGRKFAAECERISMVIR